MVAEVMRASGRPIAGAYAKDAGHRLVNVIGNDDDLLNVSTQDVELLIAIGHPPALRRKCYERFRDAGFVYTVAVHPSATVASDVELPAGAQLMAGCVVQPGVRLGVNSILNTRCSVDHDSEIGAHVHIAPGSTLCGSVQVGDEAFIGAGAVVLPGIRIGAGAVIAAGAVVTKDIPAGALVKGVPAR